MEEDKIDLDDMDEDQEAIEVLKSSQYSQHTSNYLMKGGASKHQSSLGSSPQPRRNTVNPAGGGANRMMDH